MFRTIDDFLKSWTSESEGTLKLLSYLTDASLEKKVTPKGRSLGFLAWHLVLSITEMAGQAGLPVEGPKEEDARPSTASVIKEKYGEVACSLSGWVKKTWSDRMLEEQVEMYGEKWTRGQALAVLILHQAHHRGQMTVLMRQADLPVPGIYGPSYEEWATLGLPPMQ